MTAEISLKCGNFQLVVALNISFISSSHIKCYGGKKTFKWLKLFGGSTIFPGFKFLNIFSCDKQLKKGFRPRVRACVRP